MKKLTVLSLRPIVYSLLIFAAILFSVAGCKKEDKEPEVVADTLSEEDNHYLDNMSVPNPSLKELLGSQGTPLGRVAGTSSIEDDLIDRMLVYAQTLCEEKKRLNPSDGENKPAHYGLAYSFGQKSFASRLTPPAGNGLHKRDAVFGLDCSGFVWSLLRNEGIPVEVFNVAGFEAALDKALKKDDRFKDQIHVENLGALPIDLIKTGDFIVWLGNGRNHVGILGRKTDRSTLVFQSNGTGEPSDEAAQQKNIGLSRGVQPKSFDLMTGGGGYWGTGYTIIRIVSSNAEFSFQGKEYVGTQDCTPVTITNPTSTSGNPINVCAIRYPIGSNGTTVKAALSANELYKTDGLTNLKQEAYYSSQMTNEDFRSPYLTLHIGVPLDPATQFYVSVSGIIQKDRYGHKFEVEMVESNAYQRIHHNLRKSPTGQWIFYTNNTWVPIAGPAAVNISQLPKFKLTGRLNNMVLR